MVVICVPHAIRHAKRLNFEGKGCVALVTPFISGFEYCIASRFLLRVISKEIFPTKSPTNSEE